MIRHTTNRMRRRARPAPAIRWVTAAAFAAAFALAVAPKLRAGSGWLVVLPTGSTNIAHGLQLTVDTRWSGGYGYRPVRFRIDAAPAGSKAKRDRVLRVELTPRANYRDHQTTVTQFLELPEGHFSAEATVLVPVEDDWHNLRLDVYEDGQPLAEFSKLHLAPSTRGVRPDKVVVGSLFVSRRAPRLRDRQKWLPELRDSHRLPFRLSTSDALLKNRSSPPGNDRAILDYYDANVDVELVHPADLPKNWLGLTEIDLMHVSLDDLRAMGDTYPQRLAAVQRWLATGTTLWISDEDWRGGGLEEVEGILEMGDSNDLETPAEDSQPNLVDRFGAPVVRHDVWLKWGRPRTADIGSSRFPWGSECAVRRFGLGHVVVGEPEMSQTAQTFVLTSLDSTRPSSLFWGIRHGVVPRKPDHFFDDWLIPGAGQPPVTVFRVLITLFVLVIGPLNIWLVRRMRRTYLIMVTIPTAAVLVTTVLLGYAMVRDGFGVQARIRSFTFIDQQAGLTVSASRQTYFASILPAEGMVYPADVAVYPLESRYVGQWSSERRIDWRGGEQRLAEGYLPSRQTAQFMVFASRRETPARLEVTVAEDASEIRATNRLGTHIHQLMLVDADGGVHWGEDVGDGDVADLQIVTIEDAARTLLTTVDENAPQEVRMISSVIYQRSQAVSENWMHLTNSSYGVLESSLAGCREPDAIPCTYVAVTATSPQTPLGAEATQRGSFHVIAGRW
jgi:hypothetical protein